MRPAHLALALLISASFAAPASAKQTETAPPIGARLDHMALSVTDVDVSAEFYKGLFGLTELPAAVAGPRWLDLGGGVALHLIRGPAVPEPMPRAVHLALSVDGLEQLVLALDSRGIAWTDFEGQPGTINRVRTDGVRQIFLRDPDGYWIEVNDRRKVP